MLEPEVAASVGCVDIDGWVQAWAGCVLVECPDGGLAEGADADGEAVPMTAGAAQELVAIHTRNVSINSRLRPVTATTSGRPVRNAEKRDMFSPAATTVPKA